MSDVAVVDIGSTSVRVVVFDHSLKQLEEHMRPIEMRRPNAVTAEFDPNRLAKDAIDLLSNALKRYPEAQVAIANQRASAVAFDRLTGTAIGPGLSWEDLRTASNCLALSASGVKTSPSESATKFSWLKQNYGTSNTVFGTLDAFLGFVLTRGESLTSDATNAAMTGLTDASGTTWDPQKLAIFGLEDHELPTVVTNYKPRGPVDKRGRNQVVVTIADQQASLAGQLVGAKLTMGTTAVAQAETQDTSPRYERRGPNGTFPVVTASDENRIRYGLEAFWPSAGSVIEWLIKTGLLQKPSDSAVLFKRSNRMKNRPIVVPAHSGMGAPLWDFGGRTLIHGLSSATTREDLVAGFVEGLAFVGALLVETLEQDLCMPINEVGIDGKLGLNPVVSGILASSCKCRLLASVTAEATSVGAARLALRLGKESLPAPIHVEPFGNGYEERYQLWKQHLPLATKAIPALSAVKF
jgi:glycerol kinase